MMNAEPSEDQAVEVGDVFEHWATGMRVVVRALQPNGRLLCHVASNGVIQSQPSSLNPVTFIHTYLKIGSVER